MEEGRGGKIVVSLNSLVIVSCEKMKEDCERRKGWPVLKMRGKQGGFLAAPMQVNFSIGLVGQL